jgi:hypothetical protein
MTLRLPQFVLDRPAIGEGVAVFPLFRQQAAFESDYVLGSELLDTETLAIVAVDVEEEGVVVRCQQVRNCGEKPILLVAGDDLGKPWVFDVSFIVGPHSFVNCPILCVADHSPFPSHDSLSHRKGAAGLVVAYADRVFVNVLDSVQTCEKLWPHCLGMLMGHCVNTPTWQLGASLDIDLDRVRWEAVQGIGLGQHWIARRRGFRGDALSLNGKVVHVSLSADWSILHNKPHRKRHGRHFRFPDE